MAARVTQVVVEVLRQGPVAVRVTQVAVEVLTQGTASVVLDSAGMAAVASQRQGEPVRSRPQVAAY